MPCVPSVRGVSAESIPLPRVGQRPSRAGAGSRRARKGWGMRLARGLVLGSSLLPGWALACPTCAARAPEVAWRSGLLVGAMLLVPFLLVALGAWAAIRAARGDAKRSQ